MNSIIDRLSLSDLLRWFLPGFFLVMSYEYVLKDNPGLGGLLSKQQYLYIMPSLIIGITTAAAYRSILDPCIEVYAILHAIRRKKMRIPHYLNYNKNEKIFFKYHLQIWNAGPELSQKLSRFNVWADVNYYLLTTAVSIFAGMLGAIINNIMQFCYEIDLLHCILVLSLSISFAIAGWENSLRATIAKQCLINGHNKKTI
jgi:hypothetical protein